MRGLHVSRVKNNRIEVGGLTAAVPCKASDADSVDLAKLTPGQTNATKSASRSNPAQADLTTVRAGAGYPAAEIAKPNRVVYVVDSFETPAAPVGSGAQRKSISHGDVYLSVIKVGLRCAVDP